MITNIAFKGHATRRFLKYFLFHKVFINGSRPKLKRVLSTPGVPLHDETDKLSPP